MPRREDVTLLRKIAVIRDLQRIAAQGHAVRAVAAAKEKDQVLLESESALKSDEDVWMNFLGAPSLQVEMFPSWSAILRGQQKAVQLASDAVDAARNVSEQRAAQWHTAEKRCDSASDMVRKAARGAARRQEEAALQDASDRHAQRKGEP